MKERIFIIVISVLLLEACIAIRVVSLQTIKHRECRKRAIKQSEVFVHREPRRGTIYDRNMRALAQNSRTKSVYAVPREIKDPEQVSYVLSSAGFGERTNILDDFRKNPDFVWIKRDTHKRINIPGIYITDDEKRIYPMSNMAKCVIGITDPYGRGLKGIEYSLDNLLSGQPGISKLGKTPKGRLYPYPAYRSKEAINGKSAVLTIDSDIQSIAEEELKRTIKGMNAKGGVVIVLNMAGEILAMASIGPGRNIRNRAIQDQFEPGSSFKIVAIVSIVKDSLVGRNEIVEDGSGEIEIGGKQFRDLHKLGPLSFENAVAHSSNVGFVRLTRLAGKENVYKTARLLGFGAKTGISLPGEAEGFIPHPDKWSPLRFATISFGQGVSVTPLQLSMAYLVVANGGVLLKPKIVKQILDENGNPIFLTEPETVRRVISKEKAEEVKSLLLTVVEKGTGKYARLNGIKVAGKTGTAQKAENGRYVEKYVSSFVGFFPVSSPEILITCIIDEPKRAHSGSVVATPLFRRIAERIIKLNGYLICGK